MRALRLIVSALFVTSQGQTHVRMHSLKSQALLSTHCCPSFPYYLPALDVRPHRGRKIPSSTTPRRSRKHQGCSAQGQTFQEQIREITESLPVQGWPLFAIASACTALAAYTALQILLWDYRNRRTDDPAEKDRSESYSIPPKTYTWKQENIRTGKLPKKPEQAKAEKAEPEKLPKKPEQAKDKKAEPEKRSPPTYSNLTFTEMMSLEAMESSDELMWITRTWLFCGLFAKELMTSVRFMRDVWAESNPLLSMLGRPEGFWALRALMVLRADFRSLRLQQSLVKQVTEEVVAQSAVAIMEEFLDTTRQFDTVIGLRSTASERATALFGP